MTGKKLAKIKPMIMRELGYRPVSQVGFLMVGLGLFMVFGFGGGLIGLGAFFIWCGNA